MWDQNVDKINPNNGWIMSEWRLSDVCMMSEWCLNYVWMRSEKLRSWFHVIWLEFAIKNASLKVASFPTTTTASANLLLSVCSSVPVFLSSFSSAPSILFSFVYSCVRLTSSPCGPLSLPLFVCLPLFACRCSFVVLSLAFGMLFAVRSIWGSSGPPTLTPPRKKRNTSPFRGPWRSAGTPRSRHNRAWLHQPRQQ